MMTPLNIEVLLHCYTSRAIFSRADAPAVQETIDLFLKENLIEASEDYYSTTERGAALVWLLCSTPLPEQRWVDEDGNVIVARNSR